MDLSTTPLIFSEPQVGAAFGVALSLGLAIVAGGSVLRPWPPRVLRAGLFTVVLAVCGIMAALLLRDRQVRIDPAAREVVELERKFFWQRAEVWSFAQVSAVVVKTDQGYVLGLRASDRWIELRSLDDPLQAEAQARALAGLGAWPALRHGYRIEVAARGGDAERLKTSTGQNVLGLNLASFVRVVEAPGAESAIDPQP